MGIQGNLSVWEAETQDAHLLDLTVGDMLDQQAARFGEREALVQAVGDTDATLLRWTYAELRDRADQAARGLIAIGIAAGDHVAVLAPNLPEWILLEYALAKVGAVLVTVNTAYRQHELGYLLRQGRVRTLFTVAAFRGNDYLTTLHTLIAEGSVPEFEQAVLLGEEPGEGTLTFAELLRRSDAVSPEALRQRQAAVRPGDVVQIQYTSGTTGAPKGVMLTHTGILNNANLMGHRAGWTEQDRLLAVMPLFHTAGCVCNVLGMLTRGGALIGMAVFDAARALGLIVAERVTIMNGVPTLFLRLLNEPGVREGRYHAGSTLRTAFVGGTSIPATVLQQMLDAFGARPMVIMGMTEASPLITQTLPTDSLERNSSSAGIPLPFTEIKVIDPASGEAVPLNAEGELCIRGYGVTPGYFAMPERTAETIDAEGWLHSGDLATLDEGGYLRIVGRTKDMVIRGGENIYPAEIENLLMHHPMVEQVQVVGVPDTEFGEEAFAFIILRPGAELTEAALRDDARASFSRHKVPRYMAFVDAFPQTASGKVQKFELREQARRLVPGR